MRAMLAVLFLVCFAFGCAEPDPYVPAEGQAEEDTSQDEPRDSAQDVGFDAGTDMGSPDVRGEEQEPIVSDAGHDPPDTEPSSMDAGPATPDEADAEDVDGLEEDLEEDTGEEDIDELEPLVTYGDDIQPL